MRPYSPIRLSHERAPRRSRSEDQAIGGATPGAIRETYPGDVSSSGSRTEIGSLQQAQGASTFAFTGVGPGFAPGSGRLIPEVDKEPAPIIAISFSSRWLACLDPQGDPGKTKH